MEKLTIREVNARRPRCKRCGCTADLAWLDDPAARRDLYKHVVDSFRLFITYSVESKNFGQTPARNTASINLPLSSKIKNSDFSLTVRKVCT